MTQPFGCVITNKAQYHKLYRLLKQLSILLCPWKSISIDLIEQLPLSNSFTDILVIVDCFLKQAIFILTHKTLNVPELVWLFINYIFLKHGLSIHITSNRGSEFVSQFFKSLANVLNMKLHYTLGYHPKADGQSEHTNQTLEQYLQSYYCYQQFNQAQLLLLVKFAYNNILLASTGVSSFFANKGYHPLLNFRPPTDPISNTTEAFITNLKAVYKSIKLFIKESQEHYQKSTNAQ